MCINHFKTIVNYEWLDGMDVLDGLRVKILEDLRDLPASQILDLTPALTWIGAMTKAGQEGGFTWADSCATSIHLPSSTTGLSFPEYGVSTHLGGFNK